LAIPLCLLYFLSGLFALLVDRRRDRRSAAESRLTSIDKPEEI